MGPFILAAMLAFPVPPMGATLGTGSGTPALVPYHRDVANQATMTELPATGLAMFYADGIFETVVRNQLRYGNIQLDSCPDCDGFAALFWPSDVGRVVCVQGLRLWVVDSAASHHRQGLIEKDWIVDVDRKTWLALGWPDTPTLTRVEECSS